METATPSQASTGDIVARAATYFRNTRYVMVAMFLGMGLWFAYDGWVKYPRVNAELQAKEPGAKVPHNDTSILIQRMLGFALPPAGVALLLYALRQSRGEIRLSGNTLHLPGHPEVPIDSIVRIDKKMWDRKGIAHYDYELSGGKKGRFTLDDFIYDRKPIDEIYARIEAELVGPQSGDVGTEDASRV